jgi:hypothetical protein
VPVTTVAPPTPPPTTVPETPTDGGTVPP